MKTGIACLSTAIYDAKHWTNKQHVMTRLSNIRWNVLYIEPGITLGKMKSIIEKRRFHLYLKNRVIINHRLTVLMNLFLPLVHFGKVKLLGWLIVSKQIKRFFNKNRIDFRIIWIYQPKGVRVLSHLKRYIDYDLVIYDCVDDYATNPYYVARKYERRELVECERKLLDISDLVITSSRGLYEDKKQQNPNVKLAHNVGDFEHFHRSYTNDFNRPAAIQGINTKKTAGFVGALDIHKFDFELLKRVAGELKDWSFVLLGSCNDPKNSLVKSVFAMDNVYHLGPIEYNQLPKYTRFFDALIIPYNTNAHVKRVFPIKLFEYMATGKPVVCTKMYSILEYGKHISFAEKDDFSKILQAAVERDNGSSRNRRIELAKHNTWENKVCTLIDEVNRLRKPAKKLLVSSNHYFKWHRKGGIHYFADFFLKQGYECLWITFPNTPIHLFSKAYREEKMAHAGRYWRRPVRVSENVYNAACVSLTYPKKWLPAWLYKKFLRLSNIRGHLNRFRFRKPDVFLLESGYGFDLLDYVSPGKTILRVSDDLAALRYPNYILRREAETINAADFTTTCNEKIKSLLVHRGAKPECVQVVENGIDPYRFSKESMVPNSSEAVCIFIGVVDLSYFDLETLVEVASLEKDIIFDIYGPVSKRIDSHLPPNVSFFGKAAFEKVPELLRQADCGIIPFNRGKIADSLVHPLKYYEYLAAGLPVVFKDAGKLSGLRGSYGAFGYADAHEMAEAIREAKHFSADLERRQKCQEYVERFSWTDRMKDFERQLQEQEIEV